MNYNELINKAINENSLKKLLCGVKPFEVETSRFTSDVFPTDINSVLVNCIYKRKSDIKEIEDLFIATLLEMINSDATQLYIAVLYFDACIFQEERGKATFSINKEFLADKFKMAIKKNQNELLGVIVFDNGLKKINPMNNIINFNKYYEKKYGISFF